MFTRGDFHIHSTASDGDLSPSEIIIFAKERGIDTIALADHNSTDGIYEAAVAGRYYGVAVIPAVELSTRYKSESIHLLGYFRNGGFYQSAFQEVLWLIRCHNFKAARKALSASMYISTAGDHLSVSEGMNFLKIFGAAVVLAHPVRISKKNLPELLDLPFDGLEAKYCSNSYSDSCFFIDAALTRFSFYTAGSDFHSARNSHQLHCLIGDPSLNQMEIQMFLGNSGASAIN